MTPKELADVLRGVAAMPMHNGNSDAAALRQAADLLATARVEWLVRQPSNPMADGLARTPEERDRWASETLDSVVTTRYVIETPWVAEAGAP